MEKSPISVIPLSLLSLLLPCLPSLAPLLSCPPLAPLPLSPPLLVVRPFSLVPSPLRLSLLRFPLLRPSSIGMRMLLAMFMRVRRSILLTLPALSRLQRLSRGVQLLTLNHDEMWLTEI